MSSAATPPSPGKPAPKPARPSVLQQLKSKQHQIDWKQVLTTVGVSTLLHVVVLVACAFIVFDRKQIEEIFSTITSFDEVENKPIVEQSMIQPDELVEEKENAQPTDNVSALVSDSTAPVTLDINDLDPTVQIDTIDAPGLASIKVGDAMAGRSQAAKSALVKQFGGNSASEAAVASGLKWLATHQLEDGSWSFDHTECKTCDGKCTQPGDMKEMRTAATGLALLAYLGGGHTHEKGDYQKQVKGGLDALLKMGKITPEGFDLRSTPAGNHVHASYYAQGIATIALCESVALTKDTKYRVAANNAVRFIVASQDPKGGGWRYNPRQAGDTSVVGWQIMALKSAQNAKMKFPGVTFKGADLFLDSKQSNEGSLYAYEDVKSPSPSATAVGLLCRMYLGWDRKQEGLQRGVEFLDKTKPNPNNMYYNYYATQVMHHWGGEEWTRWNNVMRDRLVATQMGPDKGHLAGSWNIADPHGGAGGRHYMTCLAVMTLEVYYRHLPIYQREKIKVEF